MQDILHLRALSMTIMQDWTQTCRVKSWDWSGLDRCFTSGVRKHPWVSRLLCLISNRGPWCRNDLGVCRLCKMWPCKMTVNTNPGVVKTCQKRKNWMNEFSSPIYSVGPMFSWCCRMWPLGFLLGSDLRDPTWRGGRNHFHGFGWMEWAFKGLLVDASYEVLWNQSLAFSLYCVVYMCIVYIMIYVYLCIISYSYHTLSLQFNSWPYIDTYHNLKLITMLICIIHLVCVCTGGIRLSLSLCLQISICLYVTSISRCRI